MESMKIGDRVRLRSGGPLMTITGLLSDETVNAAWFTAAGEIRESLFLMATLQVIEGADHQKWTPHRAHEEGA
jgi:uncharacterized protein YodC (DUF2158 family)